MQETAIERLPTDWQGWVRENVARGCDPVDMAQQISSKLGLDLMIAKYSVADAYHEQHPHYAVHKSIPEIDTTTGTVITPDRTINVLLTMGFPRIVLLGNVLSEEECDALASSSQGRFRRSTVLGENGGGDRILEDRSSETAELQRAQSALVAKVDARLAALVNWPIENGEPLQLQKYGVGNEYRRHYDWFDPDDATGIKHMQTGGQRLATIILYLTDVEAGGGTAFPSIDIEVQPKKGNALFFLNTDMYGMPNHKTLHAGLPVQKGCKIIASKWLRERAC